MIYENHRFARCTKRIAYVITKTKSEALDQAVALMTKSGKINDEEAYRSQVYAREEESTTGIGEGIAIPHGSVMQSADQVWQHGHSKME